MTSAVPVAVTPPELVTVTLSLSESPPPDVNVTELPEAPEVMVPPLIVHA